MPNDETKKPFSKHNIVRSVSWKFIERFSSVVVSFVVTAVLARILDPRDFGLIAMLTVFVSISTIFVASGLGNALVQKKNADSLDFSTLFWLNFVISCIIYLMLFIAAPFIADFYGYNQLSPMLRVLSLIILVSAINSIQMAYISRNMLFRYYFYSTLSGKIASGVIGIVMALSGCGAWALVGQSLSLICFETVILWFAVKWRPSLRFSLERAKELYSFAWKIMLMSFIETVRDQMRGMVIGKYGTSEDLAFCDKGMLIPNTTITNVSSSLSAVMFPVLSNKQDNRESVLAILRRWTGLFGYGMLPILTGLAVAAKPIMTLLFTEKWLPAVPYLRLACFIYAAWIIEVPIRETIKSLGHANICLKMQIIKTLVAMITLYIVRNEGAFAITISAAGCKLFDIFVSVFYGNKYVGYLPYLLVKDIFISFIFSIVMGIGAYLIMLINLPSAICITLQVLVSLIVYIGLSIAFKNSNFQYCISIMRKMLKTRDKRTLNE